VQFLRSALPHPFQEWFVNVVVTEPPDDSAQRVSRAQWWVLALASFANLGGYYLIDSIAPIADLLHRQLGFSYAQIGTLNAIFSLPNIVLALVGGVLADRYGPAVVAIWATAICFVGAVITAVGTHFWIMVLGRLIFGIGGETSWLALLVGLGRWFVGPRLAFAMAMYFSVARVGSYLADLSPQIAKPLYDLGWQPPLILAAALAGLSFMAALAYGAIEARTSLALKGGTSERFTWSVLAGVNPAFWYLLGMATIFYAVVFPFRSTFSIEYFQNARGLSLQDAGIANSWVFFAAIFATPVFGWVADRITQKTGMLAVGMLALAVSFAILATTTWPLWLTTALVGLSYSLVPAVLWPAVTQAVNLRRLGSAFGLMASLQHGGMAVCNVVVGWLNDWGRAGSAHPSGYLPMLWFFGLLSTAGFILIACLWALEAAQRRQVAAGKISRGQ
jgi:MFS family permease